MRNHPKKMPSATIKNFHSAEEFSMALAICHKIKETDDTFDFTHNTITRIIVLEDNNLNRLHKRGVWLTSKFNENISKQLGKPIKDTSRAIYYSVKTPLAHNRS